MNQIRMIFASFLMGWLGVLSASSTITFFFRPYPLVNDIATMPSRQLTDVSGIFVTYAGQLDASRTTGQVKFVRKQTDPIISLVVANKVTPILGPRNTVIHWEIERGSSADLYQIQRSYDEASKIYYWSITKGVVPSQGILPIQTILIFAHPNDIYVPEGITVTDDNVNFALPDIYVKHSIDKMAYALYVLGIKNFFSPINLEFKRNDSNYSSHILGP